MKNNKKKGENKLHENKNKYPLSGRDHQEKYGFNVLTPPSIKPTGVVAFIFSYYRFFFHIRGYTNRSHQLR